MAGVAPTVPDMITDNLCVYTSGQHDHEQLPVHHEAAPQPCASLLETLMG